MGIMLAFVCVGFTSCGHEVEDMDPIGLEVVELTDQGVLETEEGEDDGSGGTGSSGSSGGSNGNGL